MHLGIQIRVDMGEVPMRKAHIHCWGEEFLAFFFRWVYLQKNFSKDFFEMLQENVGSRVQGLQRGRFPALDVSLLWSFAEISQNKTHKTL